MDAYREIIDRLVGEGIGDRAEIEKIKKRLSRELHLGKIPTNAEILRHATEGERALLEPLLRKKPVRTVSGIATVAVMSRPSPCPHGRCIYCPVGKNSPQSYTGEEPAALRAKRANYDPYLQVHDRLDQLRNVGHHIDKVELIVMGGTFNSQPLEYKEFFVRRCLDAMNRFYDGNIEARDIEEAQRVNESSKVRNVGITFETRPDWAKQRHVDEMLGFGVTRVELGVQTIRDSIYKKIKRGHTLEDVVEATRVLKDSGLKVGYHMMPGLFSDFEGDLEIFRSIFDDDGFKPDVMKIYPTLVIKGTELYRIWSEGGFAPYSDVEATELIVEVKRMMPKWIRTMRIQRDIPSKLIVAGVKKSNLGELVYDGLREEGSKCSCIRCRDIGHLIYKEGLKIEEDNLHTLIEKYNASEGIEHFISIEDTKNDALVAYLRLRFPSDKAHRREIAPDTSLIRELRVLGPVAPLGARLDEAEQHRGFGARLLQRAEEVAAEAGMKRMLITSAVGTREYYKKFGYSRMGPYMGKGIDRIY
ncbi:MAG: tRNA uridine(34) 5-carboxymethylaminomethyl modification radical SAM/GNAT enzyme Elp3 [Candidatus Hydrothermarchaeales archaeon]